MSAPRSACTKATGIYWLRGLLEERGAAAQQQLSRSLDPADHEVLRGALALSWVPEETAVRIYEAAGQVLFAGEPDVLFEVGRGMAKANMTTVYRVLIRMTTVPFVMSQAARFWRTYHDTGEASAAPGSNASEVVLVVHGFPTLPARMRRVLSGYVAGLAELIGQKGVRTRLDEADPSAWRWTVSWE